MRWANRGTGYGSQAGARGTGGGKSRIYEMRNADDPEAKMILGTLQILSQPACDLFDIGASHSFIYESCVNRLHLDTASECEPYC